MFSYPVRLFLGTNLDIALPRPGRERKGCGRGSGQSELSGRALLTVLPACLERHFVVLF